MVCVVLGVAGWWGRVAVRYARLLCWVWHALLLIRVMAVRDGVAVSLGSSSSYGWSLPENAGRRHAPCSMGVCCVLTVRGPLIIGVTVRHAIAVGACLLLVMPISRPRPVWFAPASVAWRRAPVPASVTWARGSPVSPIHVWATTTSPAATLKPRHWTTAEPLLCEAVTACCCLLLLVHAFCCRC